eukprot:1141567-Pelagomonas_calceolata.AAC.4
MLERKSGLAKSGPQIDTVTLITSPGTLAWLERKLKISLFESPCTSEIDSLISLLLGKKRKDYASLVQLRASRKPLTSKLARASPRRFTGPA